MSEEKSEIGDLTKAANYFRDMSRETLTRREVIEILDHLASEAHASTPPASVEQQARADVECGSCGEGLPTGECPKSGRTCGHHCNHIWTHDECDWCGAVEPPLNVRSSPASEPACACVGYTIRTDYGTGIEHDVDRSSCPIHEGDDDA